MRQGHWLTFSILKFFVILLICLISVIINGRIRVKTDDIRFSEWNWKCWVALVFSSNAWKREKVVVWCMMLTCNILWFGKMNEHVESENWCFMDLNTWTFWFLVSVEGAFHSYCRYFRDKDFDLQKSNSFASVLYHI